MGNDMSNQNNIADLPNESNEATMTTESSAHIAKETKKQCKKKINLLYNKLKTCYLLTMLKTVVDKIKKSKAPKEASKGNQSDKSVVRFIKLMQNCYFNTETGIEWENELRCTRLSVDGFKNIVKADILSALIHWHEGRENGLRWLCYADTDDKNDEAISHQTKFNRQFILLAYPFLALKYEDVRMEDLKNILLQRKENTFEENTKITDVSTIKGIFEGRRRESAQKSVQRYYIRLYKKQECIQDLKLDYLNPIDRESFKSLFFSISSFLGQYWFYKEDEYKHYISHLTHKKVIGASNNYDCIIDKSSLVKEITGADAKKFWNEYLDIMYVIFDGTELSQKKTEDIIL